VRTLLLFTFIIVTSFLKAQGNLQFNQVKIINNTDAPQTVPAGKVWKIESVFANDQDVYAASTSGANQSFFTSCGVPSAWYFYYGRYLAINNIPISFGVHSSGEQMTQLPIWVPAGSTICTCTSSSFCARGYSAIEFNLVP
jgi:hypothetical protein